MMTFFLSETEHVVCGVFPADVTALPIIVSASACIAVTMVCPTQLLPMPQLNRPAPEHL